MSDQLSLLTPPAEPDTWIPPPGEAASSALKPLLNPLQSEGPPPVSTLVEPPRSPNGANPAIDEQGNNVQLDLPIASASVIGPGDVGPGEPTPGDGLEASTYGTSGALSPAPGALAGGDEQKTLSPLPRDAPVPPSPKALDEPPPALLPDAIPPAVATPTVLTTEGSQPATSGETAQPDAFPDATPTPSGMSFDPMVVDPLDVAAPGAPVGIASPTTQVFDQTPEIPSSDAMDVDAPGEESITGRGMESSSSVSSLKRAGDELEGRDEKRMKEAIPSLGAAPPAVNPVAPAPTPALGNGNGNGTGPPPWLTYTPPPPRDPGPTTPLTSTQHRFLLSSVRGMKKLKDAINFLEPVDVIRFGIPHYAQIIEKPIDLSTIEQKLIVSDLRGPPKDKSKLNKWDESKGKYGSVSEVVQDVRQIWENTRKFNGPDHIVSQSAKKLEDGFEKGLKSMPAEPVVAAPLPPPPAPIASPAAGPSTERSRRASVSQPPVIRRTSDGPDSRPKREIHPPPSKDLNYNEGGQRKPKRRNDPQIQWASRTVKGFETTNKHYNMVAPFLYPVEEIIKSIPHYATVVKKPMDLLRIKAKLNDGDYDDVQQVDADMRLMIKNAMSYNPPGDAVHDAAKQLLQAWEEKWRTLPSKQDARDESEDPLAEDYVEDESDEENSAKLHRLENQLADIQAQIADVKALQARRRSQKASKKSKSKARKQSMSKVSPGMNGSGPKKPRKSKDVVYREDDDMDSDEEAANITLTQKQELAEKIQSVDGDTLTVAIQIIRESTNIGADGEIELDIDSLPAKTVLNLYNLVCKGLKKSGPGRAKAQPAASRKAGRKVGKRTVNEQEEAERIRRMEQQLQSFGPAGTYEEESESSEDESSEEE